MAQQRDDFTPDDFAPDTPVNTDDFTPLQRVVAGLPQKEEPGIISRAWSAISEPLWEGPSRFGRAVADYIDDPNSSSDSVWGERAKGFIAGATEGVGNLVSSFTSPVDLAAGVLTGGAGLAARRGATTAARGLTQAARVASAPVVAHGAGEVFHPDSTMGERAIGLAEMAGGTAGMRPTTPIPTPSRFPRGWAPQDLRSNASMSAPSTTPPGVAGMTIGSKIKLKTTNPEDLRRARDLGFVPYDIAPDGLPRMRYDPEEAAKLNNPIVRRIEERAPRESHIVREAWNVTRGAMSVDLPFITSAGFRQALPLVGTRNWFKAWAPSIRAYGSTKFYKAHQELLREHPMMKRPEVPVLNQNGKPMFDDGHPILKEMPSIGERAGLSLTDLSSLSSREEAIRSQLAERIPYWGKVVSASNRAYVAYLNDLRVNTFNNLYEAMPDKNNEVALKQLADAVNTFTGRGKLETKLPFGAGREFGFERHAEGLAEVLFSPRLMASRMQMMNPMNYVSPQTTPQVRKEYLKSALRMGGAWLTFAGLAQQMGAEVSLDPRSADFGKIKIGNTRMDPAGGFQQFLVLMSRLSTDEFTSSSSGRTFELGRGFGGQTQKDILEQFIANKLHPSARYLYDAWDSSDRKPFRIGDRTVQLFVPMLTGDLLDIAREEPGLLPLVAPLTSAGFGTQHYTPGRFDEPLLVPEKYDVVLGR